LFNTGRLGDQVTEGTDNVEWLFGLQWLYHISWKCSHHTTKSRWTLQDTTRKHSIRKRENQILTLGFWLLFY